MPWSTPDLKEVRSLTRDLVAMGLGLKAVVPNSPLRVVADSNAGLAHLTMLYIDWLANQLLPDTAETEWLDRHGAIWLRNADGSKGRKQAAFASGTVNCTAIDAGTILPAESILLYGAIEYQTTRDVSINIDPTSVPVVALTAGTIGNVEAGQVLSVNDVTGINSDATVVSMEGGVDVETDDDLRARILFRIQNPPMGGDAADYVIWATSVAGVTRAWCYPNEMGAGTVTVRFMCDDIRADNSGIPTADDVKAVTDYIDLVRPVTIKDRFVEAPLPYYYDITISRLSKNNAEVRSRIETAIRDMERERFVPGSTIYRSWVDEAISGAIGEESHELEFETTYAPGPGFLPMLRSIVYR